MTDQEAIKDLLAHLEEEHRSGKISDSTYNELKTSYESRIDRASPIFAQNMDGSITDDIRQLKVKLEKLNEESGIIDRKIENTKMDSGHPEILEQPQEAAEMADKIDPETMHELNLIKRIFHRPQPKAEPQEKKRA